MEDNTLDIKSLPSDITIICVIQNIIPCGYREFSIQDSFEAFLHANDFPAAYVNRSSQEIYIDRHYTEDGFTLCFRVGYVTKSPTKSPEICNRHKFQPVRKMLFIPELIDK